MLGRLGAVLLTTLGLVGCVYDYTDEREPEPAPEATIYGTGDGRLMPVVPGARWQFDVSNPDTGQHKNTKDWTEGEEEPVGGLAGDDRAYRLCRRDRLGDVLQGWAVRWQRDIPDKEVRWGRDERFDLTGMTQAQYPQPYSLRVSDERASIGEAWTEEYERWTVKPGACPSIDTTDPALCTLEVEQIREEWEVLGVNEAVKLENLGTFMTVRVRRLKTNLTNPAPPEDATFWFARGIGKVKEKTEHTDLEILQGWSIPDQGGSRGSSGGSVADMGPCSADWDPRSTN